MENLEDSIDEKPISQAMLKAALNQKARDGEVYRVEVWPIGNAHHNYPCVGIAIEKGDWCHAVVIRTSGPGLPGAEDVKLTRDIVRQARAALMEKCDDHFSEAEA